MVTKFYNELKDDILKPYYELIKGFRRFVLNTDLGRLLDDFVPYEETVSYADSPTLGHAMNSVASCPDFIPKMKEYIVSSLVPYSPFSGWNGFVEVALLKCADVTPLTKIDVRSLCEPL